MNIPVIKVCLILFYFFIAVLTDADISKENKQPDVVARGEVQSCRSCSLNRLPDVKAFIFGDLPKYAGIEFHPIQGAVPHLVLFDKADKELERINLTPFSRDECNELVSKWFKLKEDTEDETVGDVREEL